MIDSFSEGKMVIKGSIYRADLKILSNHKIIENWQPKDAAQIVWEDIADLVDEDLDLLIFGIGKSGNVKPDKELIEKLRAMNIEFYIAPTLQSISYYNQKHMGIYTAACFQLT